MCCCCVWIRHSFASAAVAYQLGKNCELCEYCCAYLCAAAIDDDDRIVLYVFWFDLALFRSWIWRFFFVSICVAANEAGCSCAATSWTSSLALQSEQTHFKQSENHGAPFIRINVCVWRILSVYILQLPYAKPEQRRFEEMNKVFGGRKSRKQDLKTESMESESVGSQERSREMPSHKPPHSRCSVENVVWFLVQSTSFHFHSCRYFCTPSAPLLIVI